MRFAGLYLAVSVLTVATACQESSSFQDATPTTATSNVVASAPNGQDSTVGDIQPQAGPDAVDPDTDVDGPADTSTIPAKTITRQMSFIAQSIAEASVKKDLDQAFISTDFTLMRDYPEHSTLQTQITRPRAIDTFEQGNNGAKESQEFDQVADRPLDIVVVIDNSASMAEEQKNMAGKLSPLLNYIHDADWQIGVVTTDPDDGCLRSLISRNTPDGANVFAKAVTAGIKGSGNERGVLQAVRAMAGTCITQPWLRKDSTLAVLIVSDEDNCSANGGNCPGKDYAKADYLYDYLASIREPGKNARTYGLIWHPSQTKQQCLTGGNKAVIYADLIARTQGTWGSICDSDYSTTLAQISKDIQLVLKSKFTLSYVPDVQSVHVYVDNAEVKSGITIQGKVVELSPAPANGAKIKIEYRHDPTPLLASFDLRFPPAANGISVSIDQQPVANSEYSVDVNAQTITFNQAPNEYAKIAIDYIRDDVKLQTNFALAETFKSNSLSVAINNVATQDYYYDASAHAVVFNYVPPDAAQIKFTYNAIGNPILKYPFRPAYATPVDLEGPDGTTGGKLTTNYDGMNINIDPMEFQEGRLIHIRYDNVSRQNLTIDLPNDPLQPGVEAIANHGSRCDDKSGNLLVNGRSVAINDCGFQDQESSVEVLYSYVQEDRKEFTFTAVHLPASNDFQIWNVWVNDVVATEYTRMGNIFTFDHRLPFGAVVKIELTQQE